MNRLIIYAHWDRDAKIKGYVKYMLKALRPLAGKLIFVSTAGLNNAQVLDMKELADEVRQIPNFGADVEMYRTTLAQMNASEYDELVLVNSSTLGPVGDLGALMNKMSADPCDFWGMTDGTEMGWNLQGYFLVYKQRVCSSAAFTEFWANAVPLQDKQEIIQRYEHGLTSHFTDAGFKAGCVVSCQSLGMAGRNTTYWAPEQLLKLGMPLVKIGMLRERPDVARALRKPMTTAGYDVALVDEAVPPSAPAPAVAGGARVGGGGRGRSVVAAQPDPRPSASDPADRAGALQTNIRAQESEATRQRHSGRHGKRSR